MSLFRWRRTAAADQVIADSTVHGDVIYIRDITGDVTIGKTERRYRYWCQPFPKVAPLKRGLAAKQPQLVLDPAYQIAPLVGRDHELDDLHQWLRAEQSLAVRLLHAEAGHGKTRLVEQLRRAAEQQGWAVQQAVHTLETVDETAAVELGNRRSLLMVVDDAHRWPAAHLETVVVNLRAVHTKRPELTIRLLLIARNPGLWWPVLAARLRILAIEESTVALAPLGLRFSRSEAFDSAVAAFRQALYAPPPQVRHRNPAVYRAMLDLTGVRFDSILAVHLAALAAVHARANNTDLPPGPQAASTYLIDNEKAEWSKRYETRELHTRPEVMQRLTYLAVLTRGLPYQHARRFLIITRLAADDQHSELLLDDHARCYPNSDGLALAPLKPDQLAEDFLGLLTPGHPAEATTYQPDPWVTTLPNELAAPEHASELWIPLVLTSLVEASERWPHLATHVLHPLLRRNPLLAATLGEATITRLAELPGIDLAVLTALHQHLNDAGNPAAEILHSALLPHRIALATDDAERADLHTQYAEYLVKAARPQQACGAVEKAVCFYRGLAEGQPEMYLPRLADSLNTYGIRLGEVGQFREAVVSAEESVRLFRRLAEGEPETYLLRLADSLNSLGNCLGEVGQFREAVVSAEESVRLFRRLAEDQPEMYLPRLADSLNSLGFWLGKVGQFQEAVVSAEESVRLFRRLAEGQPEMYFPHLALSLNISGSRLGAVGQFREAVASAEESVRLFRGLAEDQPAMYLPRLADSLNTYGIRLGEMGQFREAAASAEEAVLLYRRLAEGLPEVYLRDLALALNDLGIWLGEMRQFREAAASAEESVRLFRRLAEGQPEMYLPDLALASHSLGNLLEEVGQFREAVVSAEESVRLFRRLAEDQPEAYLYRLAVSLNTLGNCLSELGQFREAVVSAEESVRLFRRLAEGQPEAYVPLLAGSLSNLGSRLGDAGQFRQAVAAAKEAVLLYRRLAEDQPEAHLPFLARSLMKIARTAVRGDESYLTDGLAAATESIELYKSLVAEFPESYSYYLRQARDTHSLLLGRLSSSS